METLGSIIRNKRKALKITQQEFAKKINIGQSYVAQIEKGKKVPSMEVAEQIAKTLNLDFKPIQEAVIVSVVKNICAPSSSTLDIRRTRLVMMPNEMKTLKKNLQNLKEQNEELLKSVKKIDRLEKLTRNPAPKPRKSPSKITA